MRRECFGAIYRCRYGHETSCYFLDSKPEETICPRCGGKIMAKRIRILDLKPDTSKARAARLRNARKNRLHSPESICEQPNVETSS